MPGYDFFMKPKTTDITVAIEQVHNTLYSLLLIDHSCDVSGLNPRITEICQSMDKDLKDRNHLVMNGLYYSIIPDKSQKDFETFLMGLREVNASKFRDQILDMYLGLCKVKENCTQEVDVLLENEESYISFLIETFGSEKVDVQMEKVAYTYMLDPEKLKELVLNHLKEMWDLYLKKEWELNRNILEESVKAYRNAGIEQLTKSEAVKFIGCDSMECDWDLFMNKINRAKKLYLVPSVHLGPYRGKIYHLDSDEMWLFYGSLIPEGTASNVPELSKADLLTHLSALTDGVRLEILKLCSMGKEYSSTQLMKNLDLSQSAVSRHLKQLSATGFLDERRENSSKYYRINKEKIKNTINSMAGYLEISSDS